MIKYISRIILFYLAAFILPATNQFSVEAQDKPPELIYTRWIDKAVFKGIAEIYILEKEAGGDILFNPKDNYNIYYESINDNDNFVIYEINIKYKTKRILFNPYDYFPKDKKGYSTSFRFQFLNTNTMLCLASDAYKNEQGGGVDYVDKIFKLDIDTNAVDIEIKKYSISSFEDYSQRPVANFQYQGKMHTFNYATNLSNTYSIPRPESIGDNIRIEQVSLGRNADELIIRCRRVEKNDVGETLGNTRIVFYNAKEDKIEKVYMLPGRAKNNLQFNFTRGNIYLMPNQEDLIIRGSTGLWLYRLKTEELICLVWWKEGSDIRLRLADISWDSKNLLLSLHDGIYSGLYILNIDEYLKYNPEGKKLFFSPMFSNSPDKIKPGFVSN